MAQGRILLRYERLDVRLIMLVIGVPFMLLGGASLRGDVDRSALLFGIVGCALIVASFGMPLIRIDASDDAMTVHERYLFRTRTYTFRFDEPVPPLTIKCLPGNEGPPTYVLHLEVSGGRKIMLADSLSQKEVLDEKGLLSRLWPEQSGPRATSDDETEIG